MSDSQDVPVLLQFLFGESAGLALGTASERLLRWCRAMDEWLAERQQKYHSRTYRASIDAWRRLLSQCGKPPWEITPEDLREYIDGLKAEGRAPSTIKYNLSMLSVFYSWCDQRQVDPSCGEGFNPVAGIERPKIVKYEQARVLSRAEVKALLETLARDPSLLGQRDHAFFLARLRLGVKLKRLQQLQWGQIEQDEDRAWLRWGRGREKMPCPAEVWRAIRTYLEASGRMESIQPQDYIFAPLRDALTQGASGRAADWNAGRYLVRGQIRASLKIYGKLAGIPYEKLILPALRHTAVQLRQQAGDSPEEIQAFLGTKTPLKEIRRYLNWLPAMQREEDRSRDGISPSGEAQLPPIPRRRPNVFASEDSFLHGFYAKQQPAEEVKAMLAENITGLEAEITGLRYLARALLERQNQTEADVELALLYNAYTLASDRLREMIKAEEQLLTTSDEDQWAEEVLTMLDKVELASGGEAISEQVRQQALGSDPQLDAATRRLTEEIASTRLVLRRAFSLALDAQSVRAQVRYSDIYGHSCIRLVRLLKAESNAQGRLTDYLIEARDMAIAEVCAEFGLDIPS